MTLNINPQNFLTVITDEIAEMLPENLQEFHRLFKELSNTIGDDWELIKTEKPKQWNELTNWCKQVGEYIEAHPEKFEVEEEESEAEKAYNNELESYAEEKSEPEPETESQQDTTPVTGDTTEPGTGDTLGNDTPAETPQKNDNPDIQTEKTSETDTDEYYVKQYNLVPDTQWIIIDTIREYCGYPLSDTWIIDNYGSLRQFLYKVQEHAYYRHEGQIMQWSWPTVYTVYSKLRAYDKTYESQKSNV